MNVKIWFGSDVSLRSAVLSMFPEWVERFCNYFNDCEAIYIYNENGKLDVRTQRGREYFDAHANTELEVSLPKRKSQEPATGVEPASVRA